MSKAKLQAGVKPRSTVVSTITSDYLRWSFHEASGANAAYTGIISGSAVSGNSALDGTVTNIWDQRGWVTPEAGVGNVNLQAAGDNTDWEDHLRLDTTSTTGLLVFGTILWSGTPDNNQRLFGYGSISSRGGWHLYTPIGANANVKLGTYGVGGSGEVSATTVIGTPTGARQGVPNTFVGYIDGSTIYLANNGDWASANTGDISSETLIGRLTNDGIGLLCQTDFNGTAKANEVNGDIVAGNETQLHNLTIMRVNLTQTELALLATQLNDNPREWPWVLENK